MVTIRAAGWYRQELEWIAVTTAGPWKSLLDRREAGREPKTSGVTNMGEINPSVTAFNEDATRGGYLYAGGDRLSCRTANRRITEAVMALADFRNQRVIDIGCGDGFYTVELYDVGSPASIHGVDPAEAAIEASRKKIGGRNIKLRVGSAYDLPYTSGSFDIAHLRGVLHHMDRPVDALCEALRVAKKIVVVEPNGYSPILKLLERVSWYHREHGEKSYLPHRLRKWIEDLGGETTAEMFAGFVPMFAPNALVQLAKTIEPLVEMTPFLRSVGCAIYAFSATRREISTAERIAA